MWVYEQTDWELLQRGRDRCVSANVWESNRVCAACVCVRKEASASSITWKSRQVGIVANELRKHTHANTKIKFSDMSFRSILGQCWNDVSPQSVHKSYTLYSSLSHHVLQEPELVSVHLWHFPSVWRHRLLFTPQCVCVCVCIHFPHISLCCHYSHSILIIGHQRPRGAGHAGEIKARIWSGI